MCKSVKKLQNKVEQIKILEHTDHSIFVGVCFMNFVRVALYHFSIIFKATMHLQNPFSWDLHKIYKFALNEKKIRSFLD